MRSGALLASILSLLAIPVSAQDEARVPVQTLSSLPEEEKTQVLVLATPHLAGAGFEEDALEAVLDRLDGFMPDVIALERLPAPEIALMRSYPAFEGTVETYVGEHAAISEAAQAVKGTSDFAAWREMASWEGAPVDLDRTAAVDRMLLALAAYEMETALLYWRALDRPEDPQLFERLAPETLPRLRELDESMNERVSIGVALAERLGLPRLWSVDSHQDDYLFRSIIPDLKTGIDAAGDAGDVGSQEPFASANRVQDRALAESELEPVYDLLNSPDYGSGDVRAQIDFFNRLPFPNKAGRAREALWDERNYRIAANIRHASAHAPGSRILVIIGAGHKPWLDQLLAATLDLEIVQWSELD